MKLPHRENAYVPTAKLFDYLLSETHLVGRLKSRFFRSVGFNQANLGLLEQQILALAHLQRSKASLSLLAAANLLLMDACKLRWARRFRCALFGF